MPFGSYSTSLINDTLAHDIAEMRESTAIAGYSESGFTAQAYIFNGDVDHDGAEDDTLQNWGSRLAYDSEVAGAGLDYINNVADSDGINGYLDDNWDETLAGNAYDQWLSDGIGAWGPTRLRQHRPSHLDS